MTLVIIFSIICIAYLASGSWFSQGVDLRKSSCEVLANPNPSNCDYVPIIVIRYVWDPIQSSSEYQVHVEVACAALWGSAPDEEIAAQPFAQF